MGDDADVSAVRSASIIGLENRGSTYLHQKIAGVSFLTLQLSVFEPALLRVNIEEFVNSLSQT
jgi:hypothetical protein